MRGATGDATLELDETRTSSKANEITGRNTDSTGADEYSPSYSAAGAMEDDDKDYEYVYDAFGRLAAINETSGSALVVEYTYNGLGYRIRQWSDIDDDGDVDGDDVESRCVYDIRSRIVAKYRGADADPKRQWLHHASGLGGGGQRARLVMSDYDQDSGDANAADGSLESRVYFCQDVWASLAALVSDSGGQIESVRYSLSGAPFGLPGGDADSDGDVDSDDVSLISTFANVDRFDLDLDGTVDSADVAAANGLRGDSLGYASASGRGNRILWRGARSLSESGALTKMRSHGDHALLGALVFLGGSGSRGAAAFGGDYVSLIPFQLMPKHCTSAELEDIGQLPDESCGVGGCSTKWRIRGRSEDCVALGDVRLVMRVRYWEQCSTCSDPLISQTTYWRSHFELLGKPNSNPPGELYTNKETRCDFHGWTSPCKRSEGVRISEAVVKAVCIGDIPGGFADWEAPGVVHGQLFFDRGCGDCLGGPVKTIQNQGASGGHRFVREEPGWWGGGCGTGAGAV